MLYALTITSLKIPKKYETLSANLLKMHHQLTSEPTFQRHQDEMNHALHPCLPACEIMPPKE